MRSLKNLFDKRKELRKFSFDNKDVFYIFNKIIKKEFGLIGASKFQVDYFGKKVLVVRCESPAWASELWLNKEKIMRKMNEELGEGAVLKIRTK
ncbi:MAG: DUF721 domain-containing protein [Parcubacteria group bacterium]|jgi:hypothetical protein